MDMDRGKLIAVCIGVAIGSVLAAMHLYGTLRRPRLGSQPWLARRDWRERRIVSQGGVKDFYFVLGTGVFGFAAVFLLACLVPGMRCSEADPDSGILPFLLGSVSCGAIAASILYLWLRQKKFGNSICLLETLPGVIGGWFKATIEVTLPLKPPPAVTVTLVNSMKAGRAAVRIWETSRRVWLEPIPGPRENRYRIPVRLHIPDEHKEYATWSWLSGGGWCLSVRAELPGIDFFATFLVPIYKTDKAPPEEQLPE
jgi:hypothetical protein